MALLPIANRWTPLLLAFFQQQRRRSSSFLLVRHLGGIGLLPLAILDSSIIPTFGSLDLLTAWLAAHNPELWIYYASMSTLGAIIGAYLTYRMGKKMGTGWIANKIGEKREQQLCNAIERWGFGAIIVPTLAPPPFPSSWFFLVAGAFGYTVKGFCLAVVLGRSARYLLITAIAAHYGRSFIRIIRHPQQYLLVSLLITAMLILIAFLLMGRRRPSWQPRATTEG
jgi:membrane protein YqaA with SNARE-associated domain